MTKERARANDETRPVEADMTAAEGRIEWFCAHFEVEPPKLKYDPEEPDEILLTKELFRWARVEGVSQDWLFCGAITALVATHREKHRITPEKEEWNVILGRLDKTEINLLLAGLTLVVKADANIHDVMRGVVEKIDEHRATLGRGDAV